MAFDCEYRDIPASDAARLTAEAIATGAREHGLGAVYSIASVETVPRRRRHDLVDLVVHMVDGEDILGMEFPDEARAAVTAAVQVLLGRTRPVSAPASLRSQALAPPPGRTARA